ncbi:hypothetical protein CR513_58193, partial [Mucuna pruriens]
MEHPQTNEQVEDTNKVILRELKKKIGQSKGVMGRVATKHHLGVPLHPQTTTSETPFQLAFGTNVMISIKIEASKHRATRRYNTKVRLRDFRENNLVRKMEGETRKRRVEGKLAANWEGPFRDREALSNNAYRLENLNEINVPQTWNTSHLKFYFS